MLPNVLMLDPKLSAKLAGLSGRDWLTYATLLGHRSESGESWPAMTTIAKECHLSVSTVKRAVKRLRSLDLVIIADRRHYGGKGRVNVYRFPPSDLWERIRAMTDNGTTGQHGEPQKRRTRGQHGDTKKRGSRGQISGNKGSDSDFHRVSMVSRQQREQTEQKGEPLRELGRSRLAQQRRDEDAAIVPATPEEIAALVEQHGLGEPTVNGTVPKPATQRTEAAQ